MAKPGISCTIIINFIVIFIAAVLMGTGYKNIYSTDIISDDVYSGGGQPYPIETINTNVRQRYVEARGFAILIAGISLVGVSMVLSLYNTLVYVCVDAELQSGQNHATDTVIIRNVTQDVEMGGISR